VYSGVFVRSSFNAEEVFATAPSRNADAGGSGGCAVRHAPA